MSIRSVIRLLIGWGGRVAGICNGRGKDAPFQIAGTSWLNSFHMFLNPGERLCPHWSMCFKSGQGGLTLFGKVGRGDAFPRVIFHAPVWSD